MSFLWTIESWGEGVLRIAIGTGLAWIGVIEGAGDGLFLQVVGGFFILAGIGEIWMAEAAEPQFVPAEKHMPSSRAAWGTNGTTGTSASAGWRPPLKNATHEMAPPTAIYGP